MSLNTLTHPGGKPIPFQICGQSDHFQRHLHALHLPLAQAGLFRYFPGGLACGQQPRHTPQSGVRVGVAPGRAGRNPHGVSAERLYQFGEGSGAYGASQEVICSGLCRHTQVRSAVPVHQAGGGGEPDDFADGIEGVASACKFHNAEYNTLSVCYALPMSTQHFSPAAQDVREMRARLKMSQTAFGQMLRCSLRSVQQWEAGERTMHPGLWELARIKEAQHVQRS